MTPLRRDGDAPPVRLGHLGLGAFHRSHQAWWTGAVSRSDPWGIAAFTGRGPAAAFAACLAGDGTVLAGLAGLVAENEKGRRPR